VQLASDAVIDRAPSLSNLDTDRARYQEQMQRVFCDENSRSRAVVIEGDAFELIDLIPSDSVDLVITSPPYWGLRTYGLEHNWDTDREWKESSADPCPLGHRAPGFAMDSAQRSDLVQAKRPPPAG
jgi:hypothetical protein